MEINFKSVKLAKVFNQERLLKKECGEENGRIIMRRMSVLKAAVNLSQISHLKPERMHELKGSRKREFAVELKQPYRLVFRPNHDPIPMKADGGIDLEHVTSITIIGVEDYH
jgi:proteic killer suppression protein